MARRIWTTPRSVNFRQVRDCACNSLSFNDFLLPLTSENVKVSIISDKGFNKCNAKGFQMQVE